MKDAVVMRTVQGQSRGFGFCVFQSAQVCELVLRNKNHVIDNRRVSFYFTNLQLGRCTFSFTQR